MQLFWLHKDISKAAKYHDDTRINKAILEAAQIMYSALDLRDYPEEKLHYSPTHQKHPCTQWASRSKENLRLVELLSQELNKEKKRRWDSGQHKSLSVIKEIDWGMVNELNFPKKRQTLPPMAMPEKYKQPRTSWDNIVKSYQYYYIYEKTDAEYKYTSKPSFLP